MSPNLCSNDSIDDQKLKMSWNKSLSRLNPTIQHCKLNSRIIDPIFDDLNLKFRYIVSNLKALYHSCEHYKASAQLSFYHTINITQSFHFMLEEGSLNRTPEKTKYGAILLREPLCIDLSDKNREERYCKSSYGTETNDCAKIDIERLNKQICVITKRTENEMLFFKNSVQTPIILLLDICSRVSQTIKCRNETSTVLSSIFNKLFKLKQSPNENTSNMINKLNKKLTSAKAKYEVLNSLLKESLGHFCKLITNEFMEKWFKVFYFTILRISYTMNYFCWNCPELKKLEKDKTNNSSASDPLDQESSVESAILDISKILNKFQQDHLHVAREIDNLAIISL